MKLILRKTAGWIRMGGEDRIRFLNGQVSNDVKRLKSGEGCYAVFPNGKGKIRADSVILQTGDFLVLDCSQDLEQKLMSELDRFIISDDVTMEALGTTIQSLCVVGEGSDLWMKQVLGIENLPVQSFEFKAIANHDFSNGLFFRGHPQIPSSWEIRIPIGPWDDFWKRIESVRKTHPFEIGSEADWEVLRVEAGIPRFGREMNEDTLPQEVGLETVAVSFHKGCYIGQEVISRIKSMGHVNRKLIRLKLSAQVPVGEILKFQGQEIGKITSVVLSPKYGWLGLAVVKQKGWEQNVKLEMECGTAQPLQE